MSKYDYQNLKELSENKEANFYGVIVDATFPTKEETEGNVYVTTIKLIDNNINYLNDPHEIQDHMIYVTVKSDLIEYLPFIQNIGDIFRVHRGHYVRLQFNLFRAYFYINVHLF